MYRYVPGKTAHPHRGQIPPPPPLLKGGKENEGFRYGVDLFNHGYWWEAHEAWESVWLSGDKKSPEGQCLQGLIQYSGAILKCYQGEHRGLPRLLRAATDKLTQTATRLSGEAALFGVSITSWLPKALHFAEKMTVKDYSPPNGDPVNDPDFPFIILI